MMKSEFLGRLHEALEEAARNAEHKLGRSVPRRFEVVIYGAGYSGAVMLPEQAAQVLYLGPDIFYRIIDVAVIAVAKDYCRVFLRVSGHAPGSLEETWSDPPGAGPFKQLLAQEIENE